MRVVAGGIHVLAVCIIAAGSATAQASVISATTVGTTQSGGGAFTKANGTSSSLPDSFIDPTSPPPFVDHSANSTANWVNLTATVTNIGQQMSLVFSELPAGGVLSTDYYFTVTMKNNSNAPIQPVTFTLSDNATFNYAVPPTSTYQTWSDPNGLQATSLTFGGLSGGGGESMPGSTEKLEFLVHLTGPASASGNFTLTMTPNPEPSSLALAGIACVGGLIAKRRRNRKVASESLTAVA